MSLFIISSDWRFKEQFKNHFCRSFLREFTLIPKLLDALENSTKHPQLLVIDTKLGNATQHSLLEQLVYHKYTFPILLFVTEDQAISGVSYPTLNMQTKQRSNPDFVELFSILDNQFTNSEVQEQQKPYITCGLIGSSDLMCNLRTSLRRYAKQNCSVHLYGETGTGKELAAKYLHERKFSHKDIVAINCSLLSGSLGNALLFGHTKGAYTDSKTEEPGLLHQANQSTLFLDELENLSLTLQSHLLRVLESGQYRRLGDSNLRTSRFRLITASNEKLTTLISRKTMRKDFYYRINDVSITLPPLREHPEDIPQLCKHFLESESYPKDIDPSSLQRMLAYHWPGNVRQLFSVLRRCCINAEDTSTIRISDKDLDSG